MNRAAWRLRLTASCLVLVALTLVQAPRQTVGDTKADLVIDPGAFLQRALNFWDPVGAFGQVQNQAYGYLFPMGPFFWLGDTLTVPGWLIQRAWWSLLLVVGFLGVVKLCAVLGIGTPAARILGGFAFALSPRVVTLLGTSSIEVWPSAIAPWVLVALARGLRSSRPRWWAGWAAVAVLCVGGVNAVATFAVIPLGALLVLGASPSPQRRTLMIWWPTFTLLGTLWWLGPLLLLGRYSPPFLDFIESASTTTFAATAYDALRGTTNWIPYLDADLVAGHRLITDPIVIVNGAVIVALGMWGLARRDNPAGRFLLGGLVLGLVLVTLGHSGTNVASTWWRELLDGPLAPLRNTHKFDVLIRLPLVLGLVHLVTVGARVAGQGRSRVESIGRNAVLVLASVALIGATVPVWLAQIPRAGTWQTVPDYWSQAADWLGENADDQNALLLPGSAFGDYLWGSPRDEVLQALATSPWSVRNAIPLTPPGAIRALDGFEQAFASGRGSSALQVALQRAGIRYLVLRHDLVDSAGSTDPELVRSTLTSTPGVRLVRTFGPVVGSPTTEEDAQGRLQFVNGGRQSKHRVIEVFEVEEVTARTATWQATNQTPVVVGAADAGTDLWPSVTSPEDVILAQDVPDEFTPAQVVLTDTLRRREAAFGRVINNRSASLTTAEAFRIDRPVHDYVERGTPSWAAVPEVHGATKVIASSSASDVTQTVIDTSRGPWSALDGDTRTRWTAGESDLNPSWEVHFDQPVDVTATTIRLSGTSNDRDVTVETSAGVELNRQLPAGATVELTVPDGLTTFLRLSAASNAFDPFSLDEVSIAGLEVTRPLRLASVPTSWPEPSEILLHATPAARGTCRTIDDVVRCDAGSPRLGEDGRTIDRIFSLRSASRATVALQVEPEFGSALTEALSGDVSIRPSSTASRTMTTSVLAMMDANLSTGWTASLADANPRLDFSFDRERTVSALVLRTDPSLAASAARKATLRFDDGSTEVVTFNEDGLARFDPVRTRTITATITHVRIRNNRSFDGSINGLALGVSEVGFPGSGVSPAADLDTVRDLGCGSGPSLEVNGSRVQTRVQVSRRAIVAGDAFGASLCGARTVPLVEGENRLIARASQTFRPQVVRVLREPLGSPVGGESAVTRNTNTRLDVSSPAVDLDGAALVSIPRTQNDGWTAPGATNVTVSGWKQGFVLSSAGDVSASFPGVAYRIALGVGALGLGLLAWLMWLARRQRISAKPAALARPLTRPVGVIATLASAFLVGGPVGLVAALLGAAGVGLIGRRVDPAALPAAAVLVAGTASVLRPWTHEQGWAGSWAWPQWLVVGALGAAAFSFFLDHGGRRSFKRITGTSTSR